MRDVWLRCLTICGAVLAAAAPAHARFEAPRTLAHVNGFVAAPAIAPDGRATVAMTDFSGRRSRVLVRSRAAGGRWGAAQTLRSSRQELFEPVAAFAGDAEVVGWLRARSLDRDQVLELRRDRGRVQVASPPGERAIFPAVAGSALTGWLDGDYALRVQGERLVERRVFAYSLAELRDGTAVALAQSFGPGGVQVRTRPPGGTWGAPVVLSGPRTAREAVLATGDDGTVAVAWAQFGEGGYRVQLAVRPPGGAFGSARTLDPAGGEARAPGVAVLPGGRVLVAWLGGAALNFLARGTEVRMALDGGEARRVSASRRRIGAPPRVLADAQGDALVSWEENRRLVAATRTAAGRVSAPRAISPPRVVVPRVVANTRGQGLATWAVERDGKALIQAAGLSF